MLVSSRMPPTSSRKQCGYVFSFQGRGRTVQVRFPIGSMQPYAQEVPISPLHQVVEKLPCSKLAVGEGLAVSRRRSVVLGRLRGDSGEPHSENRRVRYASEDRMEK